KDRRERLKLRRLRRYQHGRAGGESRLEILVSARCFGEGIGLIDLDLHLARAHHVKQIVGGGYEIPARRRVVAERRTRGEQRTLLRQERDLEFGHWTRRLAKTDP